MKKALLVAVALAVMAGGCLVITPDGEVVGVVAPVVAARPAMSYIPGTQIQVVSGVAGDVFHLNGMYWRFHNGRWWRSTAWNAGWSPVNTVPRAFLRIPRTHPRYRVVKHHPLFKTGAPVKKPVLKKAVKRPGVKLPVVEKSPEKKPVLKKAVKQAVKKQAVKKAVKQAVRKQPAKKKAVRTQAVKKAVRKAAKVKAASKTKEEKEEKKSKKGK